MIKSQYKGVRTMWPASPNNRLHVYYAKTPETMGSAPCAALPHRAIKKITFFLICQFPQIDHQNNQEEISDLLCDSRCPQQIRLFARLKFMRPHQPPRFLFHDFFRFLQIIKGRENGLRGSGMLPYKVEWSALSIGAKYLRIHM